jgi:hypothetical protein
VEEWCLVVSLGSPQCRQCVAVSVVVRHVLEILSFLYRPWSLLAAKGVYNI